MGRPSPTGPDGQRHPHRPTASVPDLEPVIEGQRPDPLVERARPPALVDVPEGLLVRRAGQMGVQHVGVGRVDHRRLGRSGEDLVGVGHVPLVELVVAGHQDHDRLLGLAPGPTGLLPHRRDGAREAVEHACVESADVDPQLERGGGDDAAEVTAEQLALDLSALRGQVAAAIGPHLLGQLDRQPSSYLRRDQLGALAATAEGDGAVAPSDELGDEGGRLACWPTGPARARPRAPAGPPWRGRIRRRCRTRHRPRQGQAAP